MAEFEFQVAISYARQQRDLANAIYKLLTAKHVKVFYDEVERARLWGKDVVVYLDDVYQHKARFCIIITSSAYLESDWTRHELSAALSRAFAQRSEYILPVKTDDLEVPGIPKTRGYLDARNVSAEMIADYTIRKLLDDTQGASHAESSLTAADRPKSTPEDPEDPPQALAQWSQHCQSPEQISFCDTECAWVLPFPRGGITINDLELVYHENDDLYLRYDEILPDLARSVVEDWAIRKPTKYQTLADESWGLQARFAGIEFLHGRYKFRAHLLPIKYLYYVAIQARLWSRALTQVRRMTFENALALDMTQQSAPLMLPSHFAIHMAVVSSDNFLLLRKRTPYTELYPDAWEAGIGEFMHGKDHRGPFSHFTDDGRPDLYLFLKNAVAEELAFEGARPEDFRLHGFAVEYRTLAPKMLIVYRSNADISSLIDGARNSKDSTHRMDKIRLAPDDIARAATSRTYPTWGPTSKLAMVLALVENCNETTRETFLKQIGEYIALFRTRSLGS